MTPKRKKAKPKKIKGWVVVYADGLINPILWEIRASAKRWCAGIGGATVKRATLSLAPPKRRKKP